MSPTIHFYEADRKFAEAKLDEMPNLFLHHFLHACLHADSENYELMRPVLHKVAAQFPLRKVEKRSGVEAAL